jgi:hypothetical protein
VLLRHRILIGVYRVSKGDTCAFVNIEQFVRIHEVPLEAIEVAVRSLVREGSMKMHGRDAIRITEAGAARADSYLSGPIHERLLHEMRVASGGDSELFFEYRELAEFLDEPIPVVVRTIKKLHSAGLVESLGTEDGAVALSETAGDPGFAAQSPITVNMVSIDRSVTGPVQCGEDNDAQATMNVNYVGGSYQPILDELKERADRLPQEQRKDALDRITQLADLVAKGPEAVAAAQITLAHLAALFGPDGMELVERAMTALGQLG